MKTILELSHIKARQYFLESQNYCNMQFPKYIDFKPVIEYVQNSVGNKELRDILKDPKRMPSDYENVNHKMLVKKDAQYSYRPIQLINPYLYYLLIKAMTNKSSWKEIKDRFAELKVPNIEVASIPKVKGDTDKSHMSASVSSWWENVEQRSLELALSYRYMFVTDITNCYCAIYTHTIAWALMGKEQAKEKRNKSGLLGNIIDNYMQGMQYGQTNGIPQGSTLSDFIAEIVLAYADKLLSERLNTNGISNYHIVRYRDDYRIFCNSKEDTERIAFFLQEVLAELNFQLNGKKTYLTEDVISDSIKPDKKAYISEGPIYRKTQKRIYSTMSNLQQEALFIYQFSKKHPNSGTLIKLLTTFAQRLNKKIAICGDYLVMISIFTEIALYSPKTYKVILSIISKLLSKIPSTDERERIVNNVYAKFQRFPNICVRNSFEMAKKFTYKTQGTCSKSIEIELEGDIVKSVRFEGGCHGNTQGIGLLTRGMQAADVIARLEGIDCKGRGTSCPDQLAKALASGPRTITATTKPENGPVLQNPGKQRKNKSSYTVSRTAPGNGAADVCRSPGPIVVTGD